MCGYHYKISLRNGDPLKKIIGLKKRCKDCWADFVKKAWNQNRCNDCMYERARMRDKNRKKIHERKCRNCRIIFQSKNSSSKYCSRSCFFESQKELRKKKGNPNFKHGKNDDQNEWMKNRRAFLDSFIDKNGSLFCERCLKPLENQIFAYHVHHIVYRSEAPKHRNLHNPLNFLLCCPRCHSWFHNKKDRRDYLVRERNLFVLFPEFNYLKTI